jgi:hypothetical protein
MVALLQGRRAPGSCVPTTRAKYQLSAIFGRTEGARSKKKAA